MPILVFYLAQIVGVLLGAAALAYLVLALRALRRFRERPARAPDWHPPVSVLKPVYGASPGLYECLRSFCEQDWPTYEVIFGAHTEDDPAVEVVRRLIHDLPDRDLRLIVDGALAGPNRKAANLANIFARARYDIIVLADSDVRVDRDCLASMAAPFTSPASVRSPRSTKAGPSAGLPRDLARSSSTTGSCRPSRSTWTCAASISCLEH